MAGEWAMNRNQFAIYQMKAESKNREIRFRPYQELRNMGIKVQCVKYEQVYLGMMQPGDTPASIVLRIEQRHPRNFKGHAISIGDVLVLNQDGTVNFYYVEKNGFTEFADFIPPVASGTAVTIQTSGLEVEGKKGKWLAYDRIIIDGVEFFLMEHETYGSEAANIIVDQTGKLIVDDVRHGFDEAVKQKIREYLSPQNRKIPEISHKNMGDGKPPLEIWQKYHENGEYMRSAEITEEQNYNMIDGRMNNLPPKPRKIGNRISVLDRLHLKQAEIRERNGKVIQQMVADQDMEREQNK